MEHTLTKLQIVAGKPLYWERHGQIWLWDSRHGKIHICLHSSLRVNFERRCGGKLLEIMCENDGEIAGDFSRIFYGDIQMAKPAPHSLYVNWRENPENKGVWETFCERPQDICEVINNEGKGFSGRLVTGDMPAPKKVLTAGGALFEPTEQGLILCQREVLRYFVSEQKKLLMRASKGEVDLTIIDGVNHA